MGNYLVTICGPTGVGKTDWAIRLALHYGTEILSADSRQFYREMRVGTAVPSDSELRAVPHHFIQHRSVREPYSVGDFRREALQRIRQLLKEHRLLIMVGGSGLFLDAVTRGLDEFPDFSPDIREGLIKTFEKEGIGALQEMLAARDPQYHAHVDLENPHRLIRALEVCLGSGRPYSSFLGKRKPPEDFAHIPLGIDAPREVVYSRIEARVDRMMEQGLLREAETLYPLRDHSALQSVGYQELFAYMDGQWDLGTAVEEIKKNTRRLAKRQGTWFRRDPAIHWIPFDAPTEVAIRHIDSCMGRGPVEKRNFIYFVMGVSGSGKSTLGAALARELAIPFYDGDDFHPPENVQKMQAGIPLEDADRHGWLLRLGGLGRRHLGQGAVIACSALKESYRELLQEGLGESVVWVYLEGDEKAIRERLEQRTGHFMPVSLLQSQFRALEPPSYGIRVPVSLPVEDAVAKVLRESPDRGY